MAIQPWNGATLFAFTSEVNADARIIYFKLKANERPGMTEEYICGQALDRAFAILTEAKQEAEEIWSRELVESPYREEYLRRAKERALTRLLMRDHQGAVTSILSDLAAREDTRPGPALGALGIVLGARGDEAEIKRFIEGFR